jgi:hypothetical protein
VRIFWGIYGSLLVCTLLGALALPAQTADTKAVASAETRVADDPQTSEKPIDQQRVLGVLPNYRTADATLPYKPLTTHQKFMIGIKDSADYPVYFISGAFAGIYQLQDRNPSYGQGMEGYAKRFGSAYGDQAIGNMMTEAIIPSLFHQDPRYFRLGAGGGSGWHRTRYAVTRVFVARTDRGAWTFNSSEWVGNGVAVAISNAYYPEDTRTVSDNVQKLLVQVGTDAFSNILKEFWPDWKKKLTHK